MTSNNPDAAGTTAGGQGSSFGEKIKGAAHVVHGVGDTIRGEAMGAIDSMTGTKGRHPTEDYSTRGKVEYEQGMGTFQGKPGQKAGEETRHEGDTAQHGVGTTGGTTQHAGAGHEQQFGTSGATGQQGYGTSAQQDTSGRGGQHRGAEAGVAGAGVAGVAGAGAAAEHHHREEQQGGLGSTQQGGRGSTQQGGLGSTQQGGPGSEQQFGTSRAPGQGYGEQDQPHYYGAGGPQNAEHRGAGAGAGLAGVGAGGGQQRSTRGGQPGAVDERGVQSVPDQSSEGIRGSVFGQGGGQRATQQQYQGQGGGYGAEPGRRQQSGMQGQETQGLRDIPGVPGATTQSQGGGYGGEPGRRQQSGMQGQESQGLRDIPGVPDATTQSQGSGYKGAQSQGMGGREPCAGEGQQQQQQQQQHSRSGEVNEYDPIPGVRSQVQ